MNPGSRRRKQLYGEALRVIVREHADEGLSLAYVAARLYTSPRQLQRAFFEAGKTFRAVVIEFRMRRAAKLLRDGSLSVGEVSQRVGYAQPAQFAKAFRRVHGRTPSEWRVAA